jgi:hypothetical protein
MHLPDKLDLFSGRQNFRLTNEQKIYAFIYVNIHYQELRPKFAKESATIDEIIRILDKDPVCPVPELSPITVRRILASARGRKAPGQWHFKRSIDPETGQETGCIQEGARIHYLHPSIWRKAHKSGFQN